MSGNRSCDSVLLGRKQPHSARVFLHPTSVEETQYLLFSLLAFLPLLPTVCLYKYRLGLCFLSQLSPFSLELHVVKAGRSKWPDGVAPAGAGALPQLRPRTRVSVAAEVGPAPVPGSAEAGDEDVATKLRSSLCAGEGKSRLS